MKILIVEDEAQIRFLLSKTVTSMGHEVKTAENGEVGFKEFKSFEPDIVLSDILMPKLNGLELLEKIRKTDSDAVVIMVTAFGSADYTLKALRLRANDYIMKPFRPKVLKEYITKYESILKDRSTTQDILGLFTERNYKLEFENKPHLITKLVDLLMKETHNAIPRKRRLGVHLGLVEIALNAIEHGNFEIDFDEKRMALEGTDGEWESLIEKKINDDNFKNRKVKINYHMNQDYCEWTITDEGKGFDWHNLPDPDDPEVLFAANGRGIVLAKLQFDKMTYNEKGNSVTVRVNLR